MKKFLRFLIISCFAAVLLTAASFAAFADTSDYGDDSETTGEEKKAVFIAGEIYFDRNEELFRFPIPNSNEGVFASVMDGMVTTDKVIVKIPSDENIFVYRNGKEYEVADNSVSEKGSYLVNCVSGGSTTQIFSFQIVGEITGKLETYSMPSNFVIDSATVDNEAVAHNRTSVEFVKEGLYVVEYTCVPTGMKYKLKVMIDHTPPVLKLEAVKNGSAEGPVDISDLEKGAKIVVKRNGKVVSEYVKLTKSGNYEVTVTDVAGNSNTYKFTIQVYFNTNSIVLFIIIILGIAALILYIYRARKNLKVR